MCREEPLPKISYNPVDTKPAPKGGAMFVRIFGMVMMTLTLLAMIWLMLEYAYSGSEREPWEPPAERVRVNFIPLLTTHERDAKFEQLRSEWEAKHGIAGPGAGADVLPAKKANDRRDIRSPFGNEAAPAPQPTPPPTGTLQSVEEKKDEAREIELAREQLTRPRLFELADETQHFIDWVKFSDASREQTANEFAANNGRQADIYERLSLQILRQLPTPEHAARIHESVFYWGKSQAAADIYRGYGFSTEGRLFDLWEVKPPGPVVLSDGTSIERWYAGALALLDKGIARNEQPIEHRVVLFMSLTLPEGLQPYLCPADGVSHEDKLAVEPVMVKLGGAYLRLWAYSRHVKPYSEKHKTQAHAPLLLTPDLAVSTRTPFELTDELMQQVKDSLRESPMFLETEGAYYAVLAKANQPGDEVQPTPEIGYFDLAGAETGPRYRGQGVRVDGMIGDEYVPYILPPNISGLRRVFRAFVVDDTVNLESPRRYLVDMIDPPTGLEPRAMVRFNARYYRNVFETDSTSSTVRPLLIVKRVQPFKPQDDSNWIYAAGGVAGILLLMGVLSWFVLSDRRERKVFEQQQLEMTRRRLQKRGGLKLKPLPDKKPKNE
jgi:hypothetical protein